MSDRYPGGIISKNPVIPSGPYQTSTAPGVWTLDKQAYWQAQGNWPTFGSTPADPYFYDVTLLLNGDGTNGAQNNTFLDSSTNNFTITRNGNTTQGSFSPYGSLWSNYFNGSSYLSAPAGSAWAFGTGDFTVETWINTNTTGSQQCITGTYLNSSSGFSFAVETSNNYLKVRTLGDPVVLTGNVTVTPNVWHHVAVVRSSGTITLYLDGTSCGSTSNSDNITSNGVAMYIGQLGNSSGYVNGYLSNVRIVKGTAVYTSNFTPSTTPLTAVSGTQLLTSQSNRFIDNSSNAFAITVNGSPSVQRFSPFNPTAPYSTSVIGGSGYFSATSGDNISAASTSLTFSSGNYTIEAWVYVTAYATTANTILMNASSGAGSAYFPRLSFTSTVIQTYDVASNNLLTFSGTVPLNAWTHVALSKSGTSVRAFINGIQAGSTATDSYTWSNGGQPNNIGGISGTANFQLKGYMTDLRVNNTTALYTTNFTPPTAPETAVSGTQLLLNYVNAGIPDLAMQNNLQTVGSAQVSTSVKKYGTGSLSFNGTTDYLTGQLNTVNNFGSGNFTVEGWIYPNSVSTNQWIYTTENNASYSFVVYISSSGKLSTRLSSTGSSITTTINGTTTLATGTWYYAAIVRNGTTVTIYLNGTSDGSGTFSGAVYPTGNNFGIGAGVQYPSTTVLFYNGYIDDLRITNGVARYTTTFTPPTAALPTY